MDKHLFFLNRLRHVLWLRASMFTMFAVAAAFLAQLLGPLAPAGLVDAVSDTAAEDLLTVMANSMLVVTTFSLATLVTVYGSATTSASPRAAALLLENSSAQNALATFIGAFIFSIVGVIAVGADVFSRPALFVFFIETLAVIALVVIRLLHWIDQLPRLGRVREIIHHVEIATREALRSREPFLGGMPDGVIPRHARPIMPEGVGYVQNVDVPRLQALAEKHDLLVHLAVMPGGFVRLSRPLLFVESQAEPDPELRRHLLRSVTISGARTFEQDPRFGLVVLSEIASRALSPAVNDPGTAIDVIGTAVRVLSVWAEDHWEEEPTGRRSRVLAPPLSAADFFEDVFRPIARDGARHVEVGVALQKAFADLGQARAQGFGPAARAHSELALRRAEAALELEEDKAELRKLAAEVRAGRTEDTDPVGGCA